MSADGIVLDPGRRRGTVAVPPSKSHEHRLLIANFLAGERAMLESAPGDNADIAATKRCLAALADDAAQEPVLDCGESGSTLRFLAPIAAALGRHPRFVRRGRLAERPSMTYDILEPGTHELAGNVSSQFVTGLLFALPLLGGDSRIVFTSPVQSRGYVQLTLDVLARAGIAVEETGDGYAIRGRQRYSAQRHLVEGDWSGGAFWLGMNALGSEIAVEGLDRASVQPDRAIDSALAAMGGEIDVSQFPDIFPVLSVVAAGTPAETVFTGIERLRIKECDRVAAMEEVLATLGVKTVVTESRFAVRGKPEGFSGGAFRSHGDHRIAMSVAVAATRASSPVSIDNAACCAKSYPNFFTDLSRLTICA